MNEKNFTVLFLLALVIGATVLAFTKYSGNPSATPSPTPDALQFNQTTPGPLQNQSQPQPQAQTPQIKQYQSFPILNPDQLQNKVATIATAKGTIQFEIYPEATKAASSFIFLAGQGFFNGLTFHRVEPGFVVQGGDPLGNGTGGPGYHFADELGDNRTYTRGTVAMANAGPDTNGSQFFIMLADHPELPKKYTIFGTVISGMDVVDKIAVGDVMQQVSISSK